MDFTLDIKERDVGAVKPPTFPQPKPDGFPQHKKRARVSAFKQRQQQTQNTFPSPTKDGLSTGGASASPSAQTPRKNDAAMSEERRRIDEETDNLLASMSQEDIEEARRELLERLDPSIVQMLLRRANIDEQSSTSVFDEPPGEPAPEQAGNAESSTSQKTPAVVVEDASATPKIQAKGEKPRKTVRFDEDAAPAEPPSDLFEATSQPPPSSSTAAPSTDAFGPNATHFPKPEKLPDLDPDDPDFLETLHKKYFPNLPADPSKLAWMAPLPTPHSTADRESPYYPGQTSLSLSALRFDFRGRILAPSRSRDIPVSKGLHHHGEAPEAAGYTVSELGRLARSAVPAQRCVAFQTLGRILYRLGRGEWGDGGARVATGIWRSVQENRVLDSLLEAADVPEGQGHRGSRAYAVEALWLFEKGGWKEKFQGR